MKKDERVEFFRGTAHERIVTVCAKIDYYDEVGVGIAIQHPIDEDEVEIGKRIAEGRADKILGKYRVKENCRKSSMCDNKAIEPMMKGRFDDIIRDDFRFLEQIARSYFYDVRHNPKKYIAGL